MKMENLLKKTIWSCKDIMTYTGFGKTKSYEIMHIAKTKYSGCIKVSSMVVSRDSVLNALNTSIERETYVINQVNKERRKNG
jgi:hypothetical protein